MPLDAIQLVLIATAILISSLIQAAIGFAVALVAIPILLNAGLSLPESIFVVMLTAMVQNSLGFWSNRSEVEIRSLTWPAILRISTIPLGFLLMWKFESLDKSTLRQLFGAILLMVLMLQLFVRLKPHPKVSAGWTAFAMGLSGTAQGALGTPGPPMAFWVMAHDWSSRRARGTLFFLFLSGAVPHLLLFTSSVAWESLFRGATIAVCSLPLALIGAWLGLAIGNRFDRRRLRRIMCFTLFVLGIKLIVLP